MQRAQRTQRAGTSRAQLAACALLGLVLHIRIADAQSATWTAPSSGYIYDSINRSIRPVTGFIGSAVLGPSVADGVKSASIAPNQKSALAEQDGSQVWIPDLSQAATSQALDRFPLALQVFWAADTTQAVVLAAGSRVVWLTNLSATPVPLSSWNLESYSPTVARPRLPEREPVWRILAADSSANQVLLSLNSESGSQIWLASSTVPPLRITFSGQPVAAAFAQGTGGIYLADAVGHRIVQIQNLQTTPVFTTVLTSEEYLSNPTALALSSDGQRLFVANQSDSTIRGFNLSTGSAVVPIAVLPVGTAPVSLTVFAPDRFLINAGVTSQAIYFLDTGVPAGVSFVPRGQ
jgi:hypothetical protein